MQRLAILVLVGSLTALAAAADPAPTPAVSADQSAAAWAAVKAEVSRLLDALDDNQYESRQRATQRLNELVERTELAAPLSAEFERRRQLSETSFEVRAQLAAWLDKLPDPPDDTPALTRQDLEKLVDQLDSDTYAIRSGAAGRLAAVAANPQLVATVLDLYKQRLAEPKLAFQTQRLIEPLYEQARAVWLASDPATWRLPEVTDAQITGWLDDLTRAAPTEGRWLPYDVATRELLDLLARDEYVAKVKAALEQRLANEKLDDQAAARLKPIWEWTRPAMVAEIWKDHEINTIQHLLVGVPQQPTGAPRPTFFDRIDDQTAHCVSGNSLAPGDYPVGIALPRNNPDAPSREPVMFHLVNLPTPRQRTLYQQQVADVFLTPRYDRAEEAHKLATLSKRTLDLWLAEKRELAPRDIDLLLQLDPQGVSRFASEFLQRVDDRPCLAGPVVVEDKPEGGDKPAFAPGQMAPFGGQVETRPINVMDTQDPRVQAAQKASQHGLVCVVLAAEGTSEAGPALIEAIRTKRITPPTPAAPYELPWIAALTIAARDPWPESEAWLASLVERTDQLNSVRTTGPELGAVAAAILLMRHGEDLADSGYFAEEQDPLFAGIGCRAVRFTNDEKRQEFLRWWAKHEAAAKAL